MAKKSQPFEESLRHLLDQGFSFTEAALEIDSSYRRFIDRIENLKDNNQHQSNNSQIQLISHIAVLATLTLTVLGFLVAQSSAIFTVNQKLAIITIIILEIAALFLSAVDYLQTINFHSYWAKKYVEISDDVAKKIDEGKIKKLNHLRDIESEHYKGARQNTNPKVTEYMVSFCLAGLLVALVLFIAYFFDIPIID